MDIEKAVLPHLTEPSSLRALYERGVSHEHFFDHEIGALFAWSMEYFLSHGGLAEAPPHSLLSDAFPPAPQMGRSGYAAMVESLEGERVSVSYLADEIRNKFAKSKLQDSIQSCVGQMAQDPLGAAHALQHASSEVMFATALRSERLDYRDKRSKDYYRRQYVDMLESRSSVQVPWVFPELTESTGGTRLGEMVVLAASPGTGKAQPLYSKVLSEHGFVDMGDIKVGDLVRNRRGGLSKVIGVFPQGERLSYRVRLHDGRQMECCEEHLFSVRKKGRRYESVMSLKDMMNEGLHFSDGKSRFSLPLNECIQYDNVELPVHPYALGVLIGDGGLTLRSQVVVSSIEPDVVKALSDSLGPDYDVRKYKTNNHSWGVVYVPKWRSNPLLGSIKSLGLHVRSAERFIPEMYLRAGREQRLSLLRGLMDTDGHVAKNGGFRFSTKSYRLAEGLVDLCRGLGMSARLSRIDREEKGIEYEVGIVPFGETIVSSYKHLRRLEEHAADRKTQRARSRYVGIASVEPVGVTQMQCIMLDDAEHLYLTDEYIVTHNTWLACAQALAAARAGFNTYFASLELSVSDIMMRMDCIEAGNVSFGDYLRGSLMSTDLQDIHAAQERISQFEGSVVVERLQREDRTPSAIFSRARMNGAKYVVIDQLQFVKRPDSYSNRTEAIEEVIYDIKEEISAVGDDLGLLLLHQFNREVKSRASGIGTMQELAHSASIEQVADLVIAIGRQAEMKVTNQMYLASIKERNIERQAWLLNWGIDQSGIDFSVIKEMTEGIGAA